MATRTQHYNLTKPNLDGEPPDIRVINQNMEIIDQAIYDAKGGGGAPPYPSSNGTWVVWNAETNMWVDTGIVAVGQTPNITVGTVTTGAPGTPAEVSITGQTPNLVMNMSIPKGADGNGDMSKVIYDPNHIRQDIFSTFSNINLLINSDFQIWQRGISFPSITSTIFTADRWVCASGSGSGLAVSKVDNGLKMIKQFAGTWVLMSQRFENMPKQFPLTVSASIDNEVVSFTMNASSPVKTAAFAGGYIEAGIGSAGGSGFSITVVLTEQKEIVVNWVKAEYGSVKTPFVPRSYGDELALCQRYYIRLNFLQYETIGNACYGTTWLNLQISLPVELRVHAPTITILCQPIRVIDAFSLPVNSDIRCRGGNANIGFSLNGNAGSSYIYAGETGYIELDAEIY